MTACDEHTTKFPTGGVTHILVLAESHIIINTWPELHVAYLCVESCKPYFAVAVRDAIRGEGLEPGKGFAADMEMTGHVVRFEPL